MPSISNPRYRTPIAWFHSNTQRKNPEQVSDSEDEGDKVESSLVAGDEDSNEMVGEDSGYLESLERWEEDLLDKIQSSMEEVLANTYKQGGSLK